MTYQEEPRRRRSLAAAITFLAALALAAVPRAQSFVVANRGDGTITVHDAVDGTLTRTVPLPAGTNATEPMYVVPHRHEVLVGDRGNDRVVRFSTHDWSVLGTIPVGAGVFHMWSNGRQLWVNDDVDATSSVIDLGTMRRVATVPMPADLVAQGYVPHDVFVGRAAWVSLVGGSGANDWVVRFDPTTLTETHRAAVGQDPHLWQDRRTNRLFVPAQNGNEIRVLDADDLSVLQTVASPGAHGVFLPPATRVLLVTNLPGGGVDDLSAHRVRSGMLEAPVLASTEIPTAHNVAASVLGRRIAVTHSGSTSTKVSLYELRGSFAGRPTLTRLGDFDAGSNPFGLAFVR